MSELEEKQVINWFWWESCQLFSKRGKFSETMREMNLREVNEYVPVQFLVNSEPNTRDLVKHFVYSSVRVANINLHLRDFALAHIEANSPPMPPNWASILRSHLYESRLSITKRRKYGPKTEPLNLTTPDAPKVSKLSHNETA